MASIFVYKWTSNFVNSLLIPRHQLEDFYPACETRCVVY